LTWIDWEAIDEQMLDFSRQLIALRREHPVFRRQQWFHAGAPEGPTEDVRDIEWCRPDGQRMTDDDWHTDESAAIAVYLSGEHLRDSDGRPVRDDSFYLALNATSEDITFTLPDGWLGGSWSCVFDTAADQPFDADRGRPWQTSEPVSLVNHSLLLARRLGPR